MAATAPKRPRTDAIPRASIWCLPALKGGCHKTTTALCVAWGLAQRGHRVLLVDADAQCNATQFLLQYSAAAFRRQQPQYTLSGALSPFLDSRLAVDLGYPPQTVRPASVFPVAQRTTLQQPEALPDPTVPATLFLLAGDPRWDSRYEAVVTLDVHAPHLTQAHDLLGSFHAVLSATAEAHRLAYVVVDVNPACSTLNQILILSAHFLLVPVASTFARDALDKLWDLLPEWDDWMVQRAMQCQTQVAPPPRHKPVVWGLLEQEEPEVKRDADWDTLPARLTRRGLEARTTPALPAVPFRPELVARGQAEGRPWVALDPAPWQELLDRMERAAVPQAVHERQAAVRLLQWARQPLPDDDAVLWRCAAALRPLLPNAC